MAATSGKVGKVDKGDEGICPLVSRSERGLGDEVERCITLFELDTVGLVGVGVVKVIDSGPPLGIRSCPLLSARRGIGKLAARSCSLFAPFG